MTLRSTLGAVASAMLPPVFLSLARSVRPSGTVWSGDFAHWQDAVAHSSGYDAGLILERVKHAALKVKRGEAAYERDSVVFSTVDYSWPLLSALMWVAARNQGRLGVLDFGGALGSSYFQNRRFLDGLDVRWSVVEQPHFVACGREHFADARLRFYDTVDACVQEATPDVAVLSSVLQYLEEPYALLDTLAKKLRYLVIDLTPVHDGPRDRLTVQRVPPEIYPATYPCWFFAASRLRAALSRAYDVVAEFDAHLGQDARVGRLRAGYRGFICEARRS